MSVRECQPDECATKPKLSESDPPLIAARPWPVPSRSIAPAAFKSGIYTTFTRPLGRRTAAPASGALLAARRDTGIADMGLSTLLIVALPAIFAASIKRDGDGGRMGGVSPIKDLTSPNVLAAAAAIAKEFDKGSSFSHATSVSRIVEGTQQVVSGVKYVLDVELSACDEPKPVRDVCAPTGKAIKRVSASVWSQPWKGIGGTKVTITSIADANSDASL